MKIFMSIVLSSIILLLGCKANRKPNIMNLAVKKVHDSIIKPPQLKVSAHLIYDDGTTSSFDVLNDKSIALWNTIIGSGDALKPSNNTRVNLSGSLESLNIKIKNGHILVLDTVILHSKEVEYTVKNTGCEEVYVTVVKNKDVLFNDTIPFHCGE